jgi:HSP20 family protein
MSKVHRMEQPVGSSCGPRKPFPPVWRKLMSALTKFNPFKKSEDIEVWRPFARWSPFQEMEEMVERMGRLMGRWPGEVKREAMTVAEWVPLVDITEDDKEYLVKAELPEVKKEEVKVTVEEGVLSIHGERNVEKEEKGRKFHRIERAYGSFERSFTLPDDADATRITSDFKDGVLKVRLPKSPTAKPKAIEVTVQ